MSISFEEQIHHSVLRAPTPGQAIECVIVAIETQLAPVGACLYEYDDDGALVTHQGRLSPALAGDLWWLEDDPCVDRACRVVDTPLVHATRLLPRREHTASSAYREFYGKHAIEHVVCLRLNGRAHGTPRMMGLFLARGVEDGDFDAAAERHLLAALPLLGALCAQQAGLERARRALLDGLAGAFDEGPPLLIFDGGGDLLWSSPSARALLGSAVRRCACAGRDLISGMVVAGRLHQARAVDLGGAGLWALDVRSLDESAFFVGRLRPAHDAEVRLAERYGLTPTEAAVLACLGEGMANADIAHSLSITPSTAATHVKRLLAKMSVASRLQAGLIMQREQILHD